MDIPSPIITSDIHTFATSPKRRHTVDSTDNLLRRSSTTLLGDNDVERAMSWTTATTAINCAPVECVFSSPSSSVSSLEIATSRFFGYFQPRRIPGSPILRRKDSLQLVTTIQSEFSDASTLAPSYFLDAFFEDDEDLADSNLSLSESCSPDSQVTLIPGDVRFSTPEFSIPPILHTGSKDFPNVVDDKLACRLRDYLPPRQNVKQNWHLEYSFDSHGISLSTLYAKVHDKGPCILAIRDEYDGVFGAYISEPLHTNRLYYGNGECFMWRIHAGSLQVYHCTGENTYTVLSQKDFIALGGGDGKFGLWINADLEHGYSESCKTFANDILSTHSNFQCIDFEIWTFSD
ncbi:hypothetical protein INT44_005918 [Umbelopsis vinacea]|uniref:Oxidation resistance protein 1 n=1 Tax=Umbelopsis vinacea TaxID=44442 RepID=A0A8H7PYU7_9FUNG|nr:hypothetical protein INT44_005918 [Umbelopsis vinacea]